MASIPLSASSVDALKKEVRRIYDERKSSHLSESLAAALGFNTHAALLAELKAQNSDPLYSLLNEETFDARMQAMGYPADPWFSFEDAKTPCMISTTCSHAYEIDYRSLRERAWRNVIVCAVNECLRRRLFSLRPGDNRWTGHDSERRESYLFDFTLPGDLPARVSVHDAGFDELSIHVAVNPNGDWVKASNAGFSAGDVFAATWLEREEGAWIQSSTSGFKCRKQLLNSIADIAVSPLGYGDRGRIIM